MNWRDRRRLCLSTVCTVVVLVVGVGASAQTQPTNIKVFVTSGDGSTHFVNPEARDSADDVKNDIRGRKGLVLAESETDADVVVRVLQRFRGRSGRSVAVATSPTVAVATPILERVVVASLNVGDFTEEMTGAHTRSWGAASGKLVDQIEDWIRENRTRLLERRK